MAEAVVAHNHVGGVASVTGKQRRRWLELWRRQAVLLDGSDEAPRHWNGAAVRSTKGGDYGDDGDWILAVRSLGWIDGKGAEGWQ